MTLTSAPRVSRGGPRARQVGSPLDGIAAVPAGRYSAQAVLLPYEHYQRGDGSSVWLPGFGAFMYSGDSDDYGWSAQGSPGSHCRFARLFTSFTPDSLAYSVHRFLKRQ